MKKDLALYLIEILHQTTTSEDSLLFCYSCILSKFYIKPQPGRYFFVFTLGCILSKFYIKPQRMYSPFPFSKVVSYRNSTSNHNPSIAFRFELLVVSYRNSTSNHNLNGRPHYHGIVVSYRNSTSNHNGGNYLNTDEAVVSYRNSTSNHNFTPCADRQCVLYLIEILHQTTTPSNPWKRKMSCILSKFYIKPQLTM